MSRNSLIASLVVVILAVGAYFALDNIKKANELTPGVPSAGDQSIEEQQYNNQSPVNSGENAEPGSVVHDLPVEPAAAAARKDLASKLGVEERSIVIMLVEEKTWSDGCLGLGGPAESCLMALVDGFRVEMEHKGKTYVYRTDKMGLSLRMEQ